MTGSMVLKYFAAAALMSAVLSARIWSGACRWWSGGNPSRQSMALSLASKLGFWFAQQGSIYVFIALVFYYARKMAALDKEFGVEED